MKKSLLVTCFFSPILGGIENYLKNLCQSLPSDKIAVLAPPVKDFEKNDVNYKYKVIRRKLFSWRFFKPSWFPLIFQLKKIIEAEKIDVLQFGHYSNLVTLGLIYKKLFHQPYFVYTHGVDTLLPQKSRVQKKLMILNLKNADWVIANSRFMKEKLVKLGIYPAKIVVVYPSLPSDDYNQKTELLALKQNYNLADKKVILTLGRLVERKGQDMVIKSLPSVLKVFPDLAYLIVGDGPYKKALEKLVQELNLNNHVYFVGAVEDNIETKLPFYKLADLFIMPTREIESGKDVESFGLVYLEAQAAGCPVVIGQSGGTKETIVEGETGLSVNSESKEKIAQIIVQILSDDNLRNSMSEKGKQWVRGAFTWEKQIKKVIFLLQPVIVNKEKKEEPALSVVIPAWQAAGTIGMTLESIFAQTFTDYEIIVVNDGSTDDLLIRLEKYKGRIAIINQENKEAGAARNAGEKLAKGKYLFFCDADVILNPKIFEKMIMVLELNPLASFCYSSFIFGRKKFRALSYSRQRLKKFNYISTMSMVKKKDFLDFDESLKRFQDWDLWLRMAKEDKKGLAWPEFLFYCPITKGGKSTGKKPEGEALQIIKNKHHLE
ncbi:MAG: glycosyltransferase [Patescibacteria group bacterium]